MNEITSIRGTPDTTIYLGNGGGEPVRYFNGGSGKEMTYAEEQKQKTLASLPSINTELETVVSKELKEKGFKLVEKSNAGILRAEIKSTFSQRFGEAMVGTPRTDIADFAGTTIASIKDYLKGYTTPNVEVLGMMCNYLHVSADHLLGRDTKPTIRMKFLQDIERLIETFNEMDVDTGTVMRVCTEVLENGIGSMRKETK